jgi:hypothetical protein
VTIGQIDCLMPEDWKAHRQALAEAQACCALKLDLAEPATSLRSAALEPYTHKLSQDWQNVPDDISALIKQRRQMLGSITEPPSQGRILCVLSHTDTQMGEGVPASDGVIDGSYLPPWDGWFGLLKVSSIHADSLLLLLAWIPAPLVERVQSAAEIAASEPIIWLDSELPPRWIADNPYVNWKDTAWGQLTPEDQSLIQTARRELRKSRNHPLTA